MLTKMMRGRLPHWNLARLPLKYVSRKMWKADQAAQMTVPASRWAGTARRHPWRSTR
jgi:hypothetical protein